VSGWENQRAVAHRETAGEMNRLRSMTNLYHRVERVGWAQARPWVGLALLSAVELPFRQWGRTGGGLRPCVATHFLGGGLRPLRCCVTTLECFILL